MWSVLRLCLGSMSLFANTHFQNLLLAQPGQGLFISDTMSGTANSGVWAGVGMITVQILELLALTHVAHRVRDRPRSFSVAKPVTVCDSGGAQSS